jgi:8-oxo-dGTP pyrophosphatase MutT (NUDIX family)
VYPVSVKGVLLSPNAEVVLLLNEREEWELPGGRLELGESSTECLAREFLEELGLQVQAGSPIDTYLFEVVPARHVFIATYRCHLCGPFEPSLSSEHRRIGLFAPSALPENLAQGYRSSIAVALAEPHLPSTAMNSVDAPNASPWFSARARGVPIRWGIAALFKADGAETQDRYRSRVVAGTSYPGTRHPFASRG